MRAVVITLAGIVLFQLCTAQDHKIDVLVRGQTLLFDNHSFGQTIVGFPPIAASLEVNYFPLEILGVGAFYTKSVSSGELEWIESVYVDANGYLLAPYTQYDYNIYGAAVTVTTNRERAVQLYFSARICNVSYREKGDLYVGEVSGPGYGGGIGLMIKLSERVRLNLFDAYVLKLPTDYFGVESSPIALGGQMGLSIRLLEK